MRQVFELLDPDQFAGAVPVIRTGQRTAPRADAGAGRLHQEAGQVDQLAAAKRFAARPDRRCGRNKMEIGGVRNDFASRDWRLMLPFIPKEARALTDLQLIKDCPVRHSPPPDGEIDRDEGSLMIVAVDLAMQDAGIKGEASERLQAKSTALKWLIVSSNRCLLRV